MAQDLPPLPDGGTNQPPREPTPEELEAQRLAMEAYWAGNREMFAPYLHDAPAPPPEDLVLKQRLMSAEVAERQRKIEEYTQRDEKVRAWADEQWKLNKAAHEELQKRVPQEVIDTFARQGIRLDFRDGQVVAIKPMDVNAQKTIGAWKAKTNAPIDYPLNVNGELAGLWEFGPPGTNHAEFNNGGIPRLIYIDTGTNVAGRPHATQMAGIIAAAGVVSDAEGMANSATVLASDVENDTDEMGDASVDFGLRVSNHSYGLAMGWGESGSDHVWWGDPPTAYYDLNFGSYLSKAASLDNLAYLNKGYLSVWSAGNDRNDVDHSGQYHRHNDGTFNLYNDSHAADQDYYGGYRTITPEGSAKNIITAGSINDLTNGWQGASGVNNSTFSGRGPTRDGRTKPELVAGGESVYTSSTDGSGNDNYYTGSGTSEAAAAVTGGIALVRERFAEVGIPDPSSALVKSVIMATGHDAGPLGPDYQFGTGGVMDIDQAVNLILTNRYFFNAAGGLLKSQIFEGVLTNGTSMNFTVSKNPGSTLQAMLVWTDPAGYVASGISNLMLVNDLDVTIIQSSTTNYSYALNPASPTALATQTGNFRDNAELNVLTNTSAYAQFTVQVSHKGTLKDSGYQGNTTNQPFALVVTGQNLEPVPQIVSIAQTASNQVTLAWSGSLYHYYKVQHIDEVDALATAWSDSTGSIYMTNNPAAVALTMPTNAPNRFYRVVRLP